MEGGQLAEIETAAEDTFLRAQLQDKYGQGLRFWVGGTHIPKYRHLDLGKEWKRNHLCRMG